MVYASSVVRVVEANLYYYVVFATVTKTVSRIALLLLMRLTCLFRTLKEFPLFDIISEGNSNVLSF